MTRHTRINNEMIRMFARAMSPAIDASDLAAFQKYADRAIADLDGRTPILSFNEWLSAGRPRGPFTNG